MPTIADSRRGPSRPAPAAEVGVFGGSGFSSFIEDAHEVTVVSRFGVPSDTVTVGTVEGVRVAFLPRHGRTHQWPAHRVNYRANIDVMRLLGVRALLAPFTAGSLQPGIAPGEFVVVDQLVDRTNGRPDTFYDRFTDGPCHVSLADPYDPDLRALVVAVAREQGITVHEQGTVVVVNGPRFSTRAESAWFSSAGWHVVNMTQYPEAALAREAGIRFAGVGLVTDYDAGISGGPHVEPVNQEEVFACFERNLDRVRGLLRAVIGRVPWIVAS
jgi:5'-methylthioadenosine phosphorylase